jgi:beta-phosphoglucomutase
MTVSQAKNSPIQRAVLWDLDGTIINTNRVHWHAWRSVMAAEGVDLTWEMFAPTFGQRNDTILRKWIHPELRDSEVERISEIKESRYRQILPDQPPELLPGVEDWFRWLRDAGWRQALATMTPLENMEAIFSTVRTSRGTSFKDFLDAVVTGSDVQHGKPDPAVFLLAAQRLAVPADRCVVIEDSRAGIEAARRAGMHSIAVSADPIREAGRWVISLAELSPGVVEELVPA